VLLTPAEKQMAREVCVAFGQGVSLVFFLNESNLLILVFLGKAGDFRERELGCQHLGTRELSTTCLSLRH